MQVEFYELNKRLSNTEMRQANQPCNFTDGLGAYEDEEKEVEYEDCMFDELG